MKFAADISVRRLAACALAASLCTRAHAQAAWHTVDLGPARLVGANDDLVLCVQEPAGRLALYDVRISSKRWSGPRYVPNTSGTTVHAGGFSSDGVIGGLLPEGTLWRVGRWTPDSGAGYSYSTAFSPTSFTSPRDYHWMGFVADAGHSLAVNPGDTWFVVNIDDNGNQSSTTAPIPPGAGATLPRGTSALANTGGAGQFNNLWIGAKWTGAQPTLLYTLVQPFAQLGLVNGWVTEVDAPAGFDMGYALDANLTCHAMIVQTTSSTCPCAIHLLEPPPGYEHAAAIGFDSRSVVKGIAWNDVGPADTSFPAITCSWPVALPFSNPAPIPGVPYTVARRGDPEKLLSTVTRALPNGVLVRESRAADSTIHVSIDIPCLADLDNDGNLTNGARPDGGVDVNDLLFFLSAFESGHLAADLTDQSGGGASDQGVDVNDLLFFLASFESGC